MICAKCGKETGEGRFCQYCGAAVSTPAPAGGLATLRIIARKHLPVWMMIVQPFNCFSSYKVYISVDDQEYVLKSKKQQLDIPVVPGVRFVRISSKSKKQAKGMQLIGKATQFVGTVYGSGSTYVVGNVLDNVGAALSKDGIKVEFKPGEIEQIKVKANFMGQIVEDTGK